MWSYPYFSDKFHSTDLIKLVEEQPILWNPCHANHHNKQARMKAWECVAEKIVKSWANLGAKERHSCVAEIKSKWKNIKDTFTKDQKQRSEVTVGKRKKRKYIYADMLHFLNLPQEDSFFDKSEENQDANSNELVEVKEVQVESENSSQIDLTDFKNELSLSDCESSPVPSPQASRQILFVDSTSNDIDDGYQEDFRSRQSTSSGFISSTSVGKKRGIDEAFNCKTDDGEGSEDSDKMFLLSMLPLFKNLNEQGKILARIQLTQVLQKLLYPKKM